MGETNSDINKKVRLALKYKITPVLCVGERERDHHGLYLSRIKTDLEEALAQVPKNILKNVVIAYEPIWAIGEHAQAPATPAESLEMALFIRKVLADFIHEREARVIRILYGGSVTAENAVEFLKQGGVQGLLVGRESLDAKKFASICMSAETIHNETKASII